MRYLQIIILLMTLGIKSFSYNVDDYIFFNKGLEANDKRDYKNSLFFYEIYQKNFPYSYPLRSNYAKFYIAKNYMDMGRLDDALLYFSRAVYVPEKYVKQEVKKSNYFQYRRDYFSGEIYLKKNDLEKSNEYFKRLVLDYYDPQLEPYEKKALKILEKTNEKYKKIYEVKYDNNFESLNEMSVDELNKLSDYFYQKRKYKSVIAVLDKVGSFEELNYDRKQIYIQSLLRLEENKKVIELTTDVNSDEMRLSFYRGIAFEQSKDFPRAIYNYGVIKDLRLKDRALFRIARIYYQLEDYKKAKDTLEKTTKRDESIDSLLLDIYIKLQNKKRFIADYNKFKELYPQNPKMGLYYMVYNKLNKKIENPWELANYNIFFTSNYVVRSYLNSLNDFEIKNTYKEEVLKNALTEIGKLGRSELLEVAVQSSNFDLDSESVQDKITIINSFVDSEFYKEAFDKVSEYKREFYRYKNLLHYIYPKYYRKDVEKARRNYILPQSLIYTVMYTQSGFDKESIQFGKVGLMGIPEELIKGREEEYFDSAKNIEEGTRNLKNVYEKNNGMILKTLIEYLYGEKVVKTLNFELDGDLKLETITDEKFQREIEEIVYTYAFYSAIYN
ncbi:tetratricopeptide repeat protein [Cetobacterium sp. ZWU0022]|uniref:transglycosylase SLT domain-containing protein n=1 Tax=Cetobacterium sp. ZWU0022 TaxID=1340502 RepID=UPI0006483A8C|nr:tetratricopeptide repeat protein [Cetobacterium sp. ZWU0022]